MAVKKVASRKETKSESATAQKNKPLLLVTSSVREKILKFLVLGKITVFLSIIFYVIWILIGLFLLWFLFANYKLGAFDQLLGKRTPTQQAPVGDQTPTETTLPGIGTVNISCVQQNLTQDAITKLIQEKSDKSLTSDEKAKLATCVVEPEATPNASASPNK